MNHFIAKMACPLMLCLALPVFAQSAFADAIDDDLNEVWTTRNIPAQTGTPVFSAANRFELALNFGIIPTDDYYNYFPISLDVHYRFTPIWGAMIRGTLLMAHTGTTLSDFMDKHQDTIENKMLGDEQRGDLELLATFHPVYGKSTVEAFNLAHFDWGIFAGVGMVFSNSANKSHTATDLKTHAQGIFGTDAHIFFLDWLALRLEASLRFYHAPTQWLVPCTFSVGVSFFLPEL